MKCPYCGNAIDEQTVRCVFCGMTMPGKEEPKPPEISEEAKIDLQPSAETWPDPSAQTAPAAPAQVYAPQTVYSQNTAYSMQAAPVQQPKETAYDPPLSIGGFLGTMLVSIIPVIGLIFLIVWVSASRVNTNRRNLSVVLLIFRLIAVFFLAGAALALYLLDIPSLYFPW